VLRKDGFDYIRPERLADVVKGVKFVNGIEEKRIAA